MTPRANWMPHSTALIRMGSTSVSAHCASRPAASSSPRMPAIIQRQTPFLACTITAADPSPSGRRPPLGCIHAS